MLSEDGNGKGYTLYDSIHMTFSAKKLQCWRTGQQLPGIKKRHDLRRVLRGDGTVPRSDCGGSYVNLQIHVLTLTELYTKNVNANIG